MSQIANIVVFDGASTPVSHTLIPVSVTRESGKVTALWREQLVALPVYAQVSYEVALSGPSKAGVYKVETKLVVPVMESVSGQNAAGYTAAPKVAYSDTYSDVGFFHERSTVADRRLGRQMAVNLKNGIATSVTPNTTSPVAELFDQLVAPS